MLKQEEKHAATSYSVACIYFSVDKNADMLLGTVSLRSQQLFNMGLVFPGFCLSGCTEVILTIWLISAGQSARSHMFDLQVSLFHKIKFKQI